MLFAFMVLGVLTVVCSAEGTVYTVDEFGLELTLPEDYYVFTRDMEQDDPALAVFDITKDEVLSAMEESELYIEAYSSDLDEMIKLTVKQSEGIDYRLVPDEELEACAEEAKNEFEAAGNTVLETGIYKNSQTKFIKMKVLTKVAAAENQEVIIYMTTVSGWDYLFTLKGPYEEDNTKEKVLNEVVDSAWFAENKIVYTIEELGLEVSLPEDYCVFTRDMPEDDVLFTRFGVTQGQMQSHLEEWDYYLMCTDIDWTVRLYLVVEPVDDEDFHSISDQDLEKVKEGSVQELERQGATVLSAEIYEHPQTRFIVTRETIEEPGTGEMDVIQGATAYNGRSFVFTMGSEGELKEEHEDMFLTMLNDLRFTQPPNVNAQKSSFLKPGSIDVVVLSWFNMCIIIVIAYWKRRK